MIEPASNVLYNLLGSLENNKNERRKNVDFSRDTFQTVRKKFSLSRPVKNSDFSTEDNNEAVNKYPSPFVLLKEGIECLGQLRVAGR